MDDVERKIRYLTVSTLASWALLAVLVSSGFTSDSGERLRVTRLEAERVDVLGVDGEPVMVLSNKRHIPGPTFGGREYPREFADGRQLLSGIIFFNEQGDEVGGLVYNGMPKDSTGYSAVGHFSFDQWKQNQVVALQYVDHSGRRRAGLRVWDRPTDVPLVEFFETARLRMEAEEEAVRDSLRAAMRAMRERGDLGVERMFVGSRDEVAQVELRDREGRVRARLYVDESGVGRLDFLAEDGAVEAAYPHAR